MQMTAKMLALAAVVILAGCGSPSKTHHAMKSKFIGTPSDSFFSQYGAPLSSFPLNNGGTVYRWRGGEETRTIPAEYKTIQPAQNTGFGESKTTSHTSQDGNTTTTETRTSGWSIGVPQATRVLVRPERQQYLYCEAQITVDTKGVITNIEATTDTLGENFSLSRCADIFKVE